MSKEIGELAERLVFAFEGIAVSLKRIADAVDTERVEQEQRWTPEGYDEDDR